MGGKIGCDCAGNSPGPGNKIGGQPPNPRSLHGKMKSGAGCQASNRGLNEFGQRCVGIRRGGIEGAGNVFDKNTDGVIGGKTVAGEFDVIEARGCLLYTSPSPRD